MVTEKNTLSKVLVVQLLMPLFVTCQALAYFTGPFTIVEGTIGKAPNEFSIEYNDMGASVPSLRSVNAIGNIFIVDSGRVKIFNPEGYLLQIIEPENVEKKYGWPTFMDADSQNNIYTSNYDQKLQKYSIQGKLLWEEEIILGRIDVQKNDTIFIWGYRPHMKGKERFIQLSPIGEPIETYQEKPLELSTKKSISLEDGRYKTIINYQDFIYKIESNDGVGEQYTRDVLNNFYWIFTYTVRNKDIGITCYRVNRFDRCNGDLLSFEMPKSEYEPYPPEADKYPTWIPVPIIEYGKPIISASGDIYCWARTKDEYKILKWIWQEEADSPRSLLGFSLTGAIKLTWEVSAKDADKVKEYEIARSADVCGKFDVIGNVKKDILTYIDKDIEKGETYYYKVRAVKEDGFSGYSNKAVGNF